MQTTMRNEKGAKQKTRDSQETERERGRGREKTKVLGMQMNK